MTMMDTYKAITRRSGNQSIIKNMDFVLMEDCKNTYYPDQIETVPAGTSITADFAGDFGIYGMVEVEGVIYKVKIELHELQKINFGTFDARNLDKVS